MAEGFGRQGGFFLEPLDPRLKDLGEKLELLAEPLLLGGPLGLIEPGGRIAHVDAAHLSIFRIVPVNLLADLLVDGLLIGLQCREVLLRLGTVENQVHTEFRTL